MDCPRCGYKNLEGRVTCSLCHTPLQSSLAHTHKPSQVTVKRRSPFLQEPPTATDSLELDLEAPEAQEGPVKALFTQTTPSSPIPISTQPGMLPFGKEATRHDGDLTIDDGEDDLETTVSSAPKKKPYSPISREITIAKMHHNPQTLDEGEDDLETTVSSTPKKKPYSPISREITVAKMHHSPAPTAVRRPEPTLVEKPEQPKAEDELTAQATLADGFSMSDLASASGTHDPFDDTSPDDPPSLDDKQTVPEGRPSPVLQQVPPALATKPLEAFSLDPRNAPTNQMSKYNPNQNSDEPMQPNALPQLSAAHGPGNIPSQAISSHPPIPRPKLKQGFVFAPKTSLPPLWRRGLAGLIDLSILSILAFFTTTLFSPATKNPFPQDLHGLDLLATFLQHYTVQIAFFFIAFGVIYFFYSLFFYALLQRTPGKWLMALRLLDRNGQRLGILSIIARSLSFLLFFSLALIGVSWILIDNEYRGLHDRIAGSIVVRS